MANFNFSNLIGKKVSIAIDVFKPDGSHVKETYIGVIKSASDDFILLDYTKFGEVINNYQLDQVLINRKHVISIWIYE